ncbi:MAG: LPXTG cell wall anchor domain-containing protein [Acidaminobacter sp.]|uniref:MSCRAMM family protein n=1 Tax=Acidaminobacter sp. TaxID=1872102 RepID=UPI0013828663|nr:SpaA isopeptide-forming pilin-related protein [Acidaminobacter sp.]MZQ97318.1 LPXTG cell wall anchor domain-containing protein [Acidaminobacter sp.]
MLGMKDRIKRFLSLSMILAMLLMSVPSMAATVYDFEGTFDITAGQNMIIGEATVIIDGDQLTIDVNLDEGQKASEFHLDIFDSLPDSRPTPGQAEHKGSFNPAKEDFDIGPITLDLDDLDPGQCQDLYIILHLAVGGETAYAGTVIDSEESSGAWFGFIHIQICEPDDPDPEFGSLTIFKFHDLDGNGEFDDDDEQALSGIEFEIYNEDDEELDGSPFTTDEDGLIELTGLPVGDYTIKELSGNEITGQVFADGLLTISIEKDQITRVEIGNIIPDDTFDVRIVKFEDLNRDGKMNGNDDFLEDIHFMLFADPEDDTPLQHGYTDEDGELLFTGLEAGTYYLQENSSAIITTPVFDDEGFFEIEVGGEDFENPLEIKIGNYYSEGETGSITIWKFEDEDKDGVWDNGEPALEDIEFKLFMENDMPSTSESAISMMEVASGETDEDGKLVFNNLEFGNYVLEEHSTFEITAPEDLKDGEMDIHLHEEHTTHVVYVGNFIPGEPEPEDGTIIVHKFNDTDRDGAKDDNESWLSDVDFELFESMNDDEPIRTGTTNGSGIITFSGLEPGDYFLDELGSRIITTSVNSQGFIEVMDLDEEETLHVYVGNYRQSPPPPRDNDDDEDPVELGTLRIQKFLDSDEDGIFDADEFEMVGITFELYDAEGDDLISTKMTDAEGVITFPNLEFGEYYLKEVSDFRITTEGFDADGFSSEPIEIDSDDVLIITVGNIRDEVPAAVVVELPAEIEIVEEPIPLALPDTGETGVESYYILGSLIMIAGMFLKRLR